MKQETKDDVVDDDDDENMIRRLKKNQVKGSERCTHSCNEICFLRKSLKNFQHK